MISKGFIIACLYILGMLVTVAWMLIDEESKDAIREVSEQSPAGPGLTSAVIVLIVLIASATWPWGVVKQTILYIKNES